MLSCGIPISSSRWTSTLAARSLKNSCMPVTSSCMHKSDSGQRACRLMITASHTIPQLCTAIQANIDALCRPISLVWLGTGTLTLIKHFLPESPAVKEGSQRLGVANGGTSCEGRKEVRRLGVANGETWPRPSPQVKTDNMFS